MEGKCNVHFECTANKLRNRSFLLACPKNNTMFFAFRPKEEVTDRAWLPTMKKVRMNERRNTCENSNIWSHIDQTLPFNISICKLDFYLA